MKLWKILNGYFIKLIVIFTTLLEVVSSLPADGRIYQDITFIVSIVSFISLVMVGIGCLNWRNWKLCQRFGFNQMECGHSSNQIVQFPDSFNPDCSVTFDSLPDIQVSIPGSPIDILEKYFFPKIYTEKNLTRIDAEKEVELLMKTLKSKHHMERLNIETTKEIGKGWFGPVMNGTIKEGSRSNKCVVSALNELAAPSQVLNYFKETAAYREIKHANVLKMMFANIDTIPFWTVLEFCHLGDLKSYLVAHRVAHESISQKGLLIKFAADMAAGLNALHDHKYVHRDFAIRNCLVSSDLTIKVGDYGISFEKFKSDYFQWGGFFIPLRWLAPETFHYADDTFNLRKMTKLANIWSFGVAIWELISFGMLPFPDLSNEEVLSQSKDGNLKKFFDGDNLHKNSDKLANVMNNCLVHAPKRPTLQSVIGHLLALRSELTPDYLGLMKDTLSNSGSPCKFTDVEDAFATDLANEDFNFDSIALSFEPASDDDFDIGFNARSSSSLDLKRTLQSNSHLDGDLTKTTSFDRGIHLPDEKFHESVKLYYEDMLKRHQSKKYTVDSSPVHFEIDEVGDELNKAEMNASKLNEFKKSCQESSDCSDVIFRIDESFNVDTNKTLVVISQSDIHNHECCDDVNLIMPLPSNSDPKINVDESLLSNNLHSNLQATGDFHKIGDAYFEGNDFGNFNNLQERNNGIMQGNNKLEIVQIENSKEVVCLDDQPMDLLFPDKVDESSNLEIVEQVLVGPPLGFEDIFAFKSEEVDVEKNIPFEHINNEKIKI